MSYVHSEVLGVDKMSILQSVLVLILLFQKGVLGFVDMTCTPSDTALNEASICTCTSDSGTGIAWQKDGTNVMLCYNGGSCDTTLSDYDNGYSTSGTNKVFTITIKVFGYSDCSVFACKDQDTTDTDQQTLTLHEFNGGTASINSEPGSKTNGSIEITTGCVFKGSDIEVNWYSVDSTNESKTYSPDTLFKTQTTCSDATKVCSGENAVTLNTGFTHTEKTGECVKFRVEVFHPADPSNKLEWTTTGEYCIGVDCTCECKCICRKMVIAAIVIGIVGAIILPIVVGGTVKEYFGHVGRKTALVVDSIGIVLGVISFVLGIVVQGQDCCEDDADCCEDTDCCEDGCDRNWIENTGAAFIAIGGLVGIAGGVIFYLIWFGRIRPGNNGCNAFNCFNGGNDGGNNGGRVYSGPEDTHVETSDRANSDGEVSRKDVHVQENRDNFSGRPMPPIPLTDKKGRGLSANYDDDDHPLIPERRAGDVMPFEEETKKKKKKKRKAVNDDDDDE